MKIINKARKLYREQIATNDLNDYIEQDLSKESERMIHHFSKDNEGKQ